MCPINDSPLSFLGPEVHYFYQKCPLPVSYKAMASYVALAALFGARDNNRFRELGCPLQFDFLTCFFFFFFWGGGGFNREGRDGAAPPYPPLYAINITVPFNSFS